MNSRRRGQVWEERQPNRAATHTFIVLGEEGGWYKLLNVETGEPDDVSVWALDEGTSRWRRIA